MEREEYLTEYHTCPGARLIADFYDVEKSCGEGYKAIIFQGSNMIAEIEAVSQKQAHFLAQKEYPEARTPGQEAKRQDDEWNSPEGRRWRRLNPGK